MSAQYYDRVVGNILFPLDVIAHATCDSQPKKYEATPERINKEAALQRDKPEHCHTGDRDDDGRDKIPGVEKQRAKKI